MPQDILDIVQAGIEVAKSASKMKDDIVEEKDIPQDENAFKDISGDIKDSLKPGERFLTEAEAKARRQKIMELRRKKGLTDY